MIEGINFYGYSINGNHAIQAFGFSINIFAFLFACLIGWLFGRRAFILTMILSWAIIGAVSLLMIWWWPCDF